MIEDMALSQYHIAASAMKSSATCTCWIDPLGPGHARCTCSEVCSVVLYCVAVDHSIEACWQLPYSRTQTDMANANNLARTTAIATWNQAKCLRKRD